MSLGQCPHTSTHVQFPSPDSTLPILPCLLRGLSTSQFPFSKPPHSLYHRVFMYVEHGAGIRALLTWLGGEPCGKTPLSGFVAVPPVMWNRPAMIHRQQMWGLVIAHRWLPADSC